MKHFLIIVILISASHSIAFGEDWNLWGNYQEGKKAKKTGLLKSRVKPKNIIIPPGWFPRNTTGNDTETCEDCRYEYRVKFFEENDAVYQVVYVAVYKPDGSKSNRILKVIKH